MFQYNREKQGYDDAFFFFGGYSDVQFTVKERTQWVAAWIKGSNYVPLEYTTECNSTQIL